ncbi:hypothetical protein L596_020590 [Steinernema carpocapsae]|uniref:Apoptosis regulator Bcl-2 family BH4 domain-containing protein n=1 Tax=Steinernema carpocapsae TaxID=34508 RepID=A0A4U5MTZ6_STECR|nr:hypothetical protein L596_020590 [Steinernema carpocapsae]
MDIACYAITGMPDYLLEEYSPQSFVSDYIDRRVTDEGLHWWLCPDRAYEPEVAHHMLYEVCRIFESRNNEDLKKLVQMLLADKHSSITFNSYIDVLDNMHKNDNEEDVQMPYGRLVAITAFAGLVALHLAKENLQQTISDIAVYTARYIERGIRKQWPVLHRSWDGFVKLAKGIIRRQKAADDHEERFWGAQKTLLYGAAAVAVFVGIGFWSMRLFR